MKEFIGLCFLILTLAAVDGYIKPSTLNILKKNTEDLIPKGKFLYFAYGSNLFEPRIHIQNPSAEFYSIAKLPGYRLDFNMTLGSWGGAVGTIVPDPSHEVWGALWTMNDKDLKNIDSQEGVDQGWYYPLDVVVVTPEDQRIVARTYKEFVDPPYKHPSALEWERQPSNTYLQVILIGAINVGLPAPYIRWLYQFKTNGYHADTQLLQKLGYPFFY